MQPANRPADLAALRKHWGLWTAVVELFARRRGARRRVNPREYEGLHQELLAACRVLAEAGDAGKRPFYQRLEELAQPWLTLLVLERTDREILFDLLGRCRGAARALGGGGWGDVARRGLVWGLAALAPAGLGFVLWRADWLWGSAAERVQDAWSQVRWVALGSVGVEPWLAGGAVLVVVATVLLWRAARG
jgi:hypothetical protein